MKYCTLAAFLGVVFFNQFAKADTLNVVGGGSGNWNIGWWGEAWKGSHWCGDTLALDTKPDTLTSAPDTQYNVENSDFVVDTVKTTKLAEKFDSLQVTTTKIEATKVLRDSAKDSLVDIVTNVTTIIDSSYIVSCTNTDFLTDMGGGPSEGQTYLNYSYRVRNHWAQLPFVWNGWQGYDSITITPYKKLLITYKGILPVHQLNLSFFYASWGANVDTMRNFLKLGDGVGILQSSPDAWKTVVLSIPDSVTLAGITGIVLAVEVVPGKTVGDTSDVGSIKIAQISFIKDDENAVRQPGGLHGKLQNQYYFTPRSSGTIDVAVYSLSGVLIGSRTLKVDPSQTYSVRNLARQDGFVTGQIRLVTVRGAGVNISTKVW